MAITDESTGMVMPVSPMYGNGGGFGSGFGGDGWWILLLFILIGGWNGGGYGNGNGAVPYMMNNTVTSDVQRGFDQSAIISGINGISSGLCNGFAGVQQSLTNGFAQAEISNNARQIADMQQAFASQTAVTAGMTGLQAQLAQCCCDNRSATEGLKYTIATEACADRSAITEALREVIASNTANTQMILDKMCAQEIETLRTQNANLQTQLNMQNLAASQTAQTAQLIADNTAQTQYIVNRVAPYPIPSYTVPNPYGTVVSTPATTG